MNTLLEINNPILNNPTKMSWTTFNYLKAKGYNPTTFMKNKHTISQIGLLVAVSKDCLLYYCDIDNSAIMLSPKTGINTVNSGGMARILAHWDGFLKNQ